MGNTTGGKRHNSGDSSGAMLGVYDEPSARKARLLMQPSLDDSAEFESGTFRGHVVERLEPQTRSRAQSLGSGRPVAVDPNYKEKLPTVFKWEGGGKEVMVSGSFNNWKTKIPMVKSHGDFYTIVDLPEGDHEYKFYVDGSWQVNHEEPLATSEIGTQNNVVKVDKSDFEVFEALQKDSIETGAPLPKHGPINANVSGSPPGEYSQDVPVRKANEKHSAPPLLPPHLLQVILNKDTPINCEPTLLPEPNHVMLNHLYALSIKDGVMVLSATHRYRKKYVTTLLYKPI